MFPARMSPDRRSPDRTSPACQDRGPAGARALVVRAVVVAGTAALGTLVAWLVGVGAPADATERLTADGTELLAATSPAAHPEDHVEGGTSDPIASAVSGLDEVVLSKAAAPEQEVDGEELGGEAIGREVGSKAAAPEPSAPVTETAPMIETAPVTESAPVTETATAGPETPPERGPTGDQLAKSPVVHVLDQARPVLEPVARTADAITGEAASAEPVSAVLADIGGADVAGLVSPLWMEPGPVPPSPDALSPSSGGKLEPEAEPARVDDGPMSPEVGVSDHLRPRAEQAAPTGEHPGELRETPTSPAEREAPSTEAFNAHPSPAPGAVGAVVDGAGHAGFAVGWYPVAFPADGSCPSVRVPDEDRGCSGTSAPQPGTTPD